MHKFLFLAVATSLIISCKSPTKKTRSNAEADIKEMVKNYPGLNAGTGTFSITESEGWTKRDTTFSGLQAVFITSASEGNDDTFLENINIVTEKAQGYSTEKYFEANLETMIAQMPGFKKINSGEAELNGLATKTLLYQHNYSGVPAEVSCNFVVVNNVGYVINCTTLKGGMQKWKPKFDEMVGTFKVN
jgi:hypothetical protein